MDQEQKENFWSSQESEVIRILEKFTSEVQQFNKAESPLVVVEKILSWTEGEPLLTDKVCQLILNSQTSINTDEEEEKVGKLVQNGLIDNWKEKGAKEHLEKISQFFLDSDPRLLGLYQQILEQEVSANNGQLQEQLLGSGLVVKQEGKLKLANRIYEKVFNQSWLEEMFQELRPYGKQLKVWLNSDCKDESPLLLGEELQNALLWSKGRKLSDEDNKFLIRSQLFNLRRK